MNAIAIANESEQAGLESDPELGACARMSQITVPTMVACGTLDLPAFTVGNRMLANSLPQGEFVALEDMAHLPSLEAPAVVAELVVRALAGGGCAATPSV